MTTWRRIGLRDGRLIAFGFCLVAVLILWPILAHRYLPLVDLPNHIARQFVAANPGTALDAYYSYSFSAKGNSTVDVLWLSLGRHVADVYVFSSLVTAFSALNLIGGAMVLGRVIHERWTLWPLAAALFIFSAPFFWGFQNYLTALPFAFYFLALWLWAEPWRPWKRAVLFVPLAWMLCQLHILAFAVLLATAFGRELQRLILSGHLWLRHLALHAVSAVPFLIPLGLVFAASLQAPPNLYGNNTRFTSLRDAYQALTAPFEVVSSDGAAALWWTSLAIAVITLHLLLALFNRTGPRLVIAPKALGPVVAITVLALTMPAKLDGVSLVQLRFPVVAIIVLIAGTSWQGLPGKVAALLACLLLAVVASRSVAVERLAARYNAHVTDFVSVLDEVPAGSRLLPVRMTTLYANRAFWHLQAYAVPEAQSFVPTLFLGAHGLRILPDWKTMAVAQGMSVPAGFVLGPESTRYAEAGAFWKDWRTNFTHLVAFDPLTPELTSEQGLSRTATRGRFELYTITPPG